MWSTAAPGVKAGLEYTTPLHFAGVRFIISGLMILPFTVKAGSYIRIVRENYKLFLLVTLFQSVINYLFFYMGMARVPGAVGAIIIGSQPLIIAVIAAIMTNENRLTLKKSAIIALGLAGVVLVSAGRQGLKLGTPGEVLGALMILVANMASGISNVLVSKNRKKINPFVLSSFSIFTGGVILYIISLFTEETTLIITGDGATRYYIILLWLSFMSSFAFSVWYILLQRPGVKVADLNFYKFIIPVFGAIISWVLIVDEKPEWLTISGIIIITSSLLLFYSCNHKTGKC